MAHYFGRNSRSWQPASANRLTARTISRSHDPAGNTSRGARPEGPATRGGSARGRAAGQLLMPHMGCFLLIARLPSTRRVRRWHSQSVFDPPKSGLQRVRTIGNAGSAQLAAAGRSPCKPKSPPHSRTRLHAGGRYLEERPRGIVRLRGHSRMIGESRGFRRFLRWSRPRPGRGGATECDRLVWSLRQR